MKDFGVTRAESATLREHNDTNRNIENDTTSITQRIKKVGEKVAAVTIVPIAAIGISACGGEKGGVGGSADTELRYAASCADAYKADSNSRAIQLNSRYGSTFEEQIDAGIIVDTDGSTPVRYFTEVQQAQLITSYGRIGDMYIGGYKTAEERPRDLRVVVYNDPVNPSSSEASDGKLTGDACVMYGDERQWATIKSQASYSHYQDGDVSPRIAKN